MLKRILTVLLVVAIFGGQFATSAWAAEPDITAESAVLIDQDTGRVLWQKDARQKRNPASTTKILTALLALEKGNLNDIVTVSKNAFSVEPTVVWLREGEKLPLENLLYAMLMHSANDAAVAVAEHIGGGSAAQFAQMMNQRVREMGLTDTHFTNPHGLTEDDHYSSAYDMAMIAWEAMKNPKFREIVAAKTKPWHGQDWGGPLSNFNELLRYYPGATGIKNGYTSAAGWCLVASATREQRSFIAVVMGSSGKSAMWDDAAAVLDYGFDNYSYATFVNRGEEIASLNIGGEEEPQQLRLLAGESFSYLVGGKDSIMPERKLVLSKLEPPIKTGDELGYISFRMEGKEIKRVKIEADGNIDKPVTWLDWWLRFSWVLAGLVVLRFIIRALQKRRKRRRVYASYRGGGRYRRSRWQ